MRDTLLFVLIVASFYLGFACLALSQQRHWRFASGSDPPSRGVIVGVRAVGAVLLILGFGVALLRDGPSFGTVLACMLICASAIGVALSLAWWPRSLQSLVHWIGNRAAK